MEPAKRDKKSLISFPHFDLAEIRTPSIKISVPTVLTDLSKKISPQSQTESSGLLGSSSGWNSSFKSMGFSGRSSHP